MEVTFLKSGGDPVYSLCDSGIWGWLTIAVAHKVVLATLSPQRRTLTHFLRGWVAPVIRKVKVLCYRLTYYNCQICFVESEKLLLKWYLKSSSCCPFILAKKRQCEQDIPGKTCLLPASQRNSLWAADLWRSKQSRDRFNFHLAHRSMGLAVKFSSSMLQRCPT